MIIDASIWHCGKYCVYLCMISQGGEVAASMKLNVKTARVWLMLCPFLLNGNI